MPCSSPPPRTSGVSRPLAAAAEEEGNAGAEVFRQACTEPYAAAVQDVELLAGGGTAVVALRDTCRLRLFDVRASAESGQVNLNPMGDEHVGFVAAQLALSLDGALLAVSTDGPRILVLRVAGAHAIRTHGSAGTALSLAGTCACLGQAARLSDKPGASGVSEPRALVTAAQAGSMCATSAASPWSPSTSPPRCGTPAASISWRQRRLGRFSSSMSARARYAPPA